MSSPSDQLILPGVAAENAGPRSDTQRRAGFGIGIDPSLTGTGIIVMNEAGHVVINQRIETEATGLLIKTRFDRLFRIRDAILNVSNPFNPYAVGIEGYSFRSMSGLAIMRIELGALIRSAFVTQGIPVYEIAPTTLKKWACGKGNVKGKTAVIMSLVKRWGVEFGSDDEYDAYCLARMAIQKSGLEEPTLTFQMDTVKALGVEKVKPKKRRGARNDDNG